MIQRDSANNFLIVTAIAASKEPGVVVPACSTTPGVEVPATAEAEAGELHAKAQPGPFTKTLSQKYIESEM